MAALEQIVTVKVNSDRITWQRNNNIEIMATALLLAAAILVKKNEDQTFLADYDINNLPALLVESLSRNIDASIY